MSLPMVKKIKAKIDQLNNDSWAARVSNSVQAFELSKEAVELSRSITYKKGLAEGLRTYGFCHIRLSKHNEAGNLLLESLQLFGELEDLKGQSDVHEYLGIIHRSFGNFDRSLESLYRALELRLQTDYPEGVSLSYYHLGITYRYLVIMKKHWIICCKACPKPEKSGPGFLNPIL
jgi:tetratricopeptide (TPR) repeat protein